MKKNFVILMLSVTSLFSFSLGAILSRNSVLGELAIETDKADAQVGLGLYTSYRNIALNIKASDYDDAICLAELMASSIYDDLRECWSNELCRPAIEEKVHQEVQEITGKVPLKINYRKTRNGFNKKGVGVD